MVVIQMHCPCHMTDFQTRLSTRGRFWYETSYIDSMVGAPVLSLLAGASFETGATERLAAGPKIRYFGVLRPYTAVRRRCFTVVRQNYARPPV